MNLWILSNEYIYLEYVKWFSRANNKKAQPLFSPTFELLQFLCLISSSYIWKLLASHFARGGHTFLFPAVYYYSPTFLICTFTFPVLGLIIFTSNFLTVVFSVLCLLVDSESWKSANSIYILVTNYSGLPQHDAAY